VTTFALVHGGAHGAWCWERVTAELEARGHATVAVDLPCEDDDAGAATYADTVLHALPDEPVVLVAHSLGGLTVPLVAAARPALRMIFVSALLPVPGRSFRDQQQEEEIMFPYVGGKAGLRERFYERCAPEDADRAMRLLRRQSETPFVERTPLEAWPDVPASSIVCGDDRAVSPAWSVRAARGRLGVEPVVLEGSDHSPFLSRPVELADLLVRLGSPA
jgi:pimeloyl-ACP methyl ester carboxylesterase